jgi:hypothetical protein
MTDMESLNKQEIGFLKEQINRLEASMTLGFATINAKLELMTDNYVKREELRATIKPIKDDVEGLMDDRKWAVRIVFGVIITAILGVIITIKYKI